MLDILGDPVERPATDVPGDSGGQKRPGDDSDREPELPLPAAGKPPVGHERECEHLVLLEDRVECDSQDERRDREQRRTENRHDATNNQIRQVVRSVLPGEVPHRTIGSLPEVVE